MRTKIAVPIAAADRTGVLNQTKEAVASGAEMLELRTDYLESLSADLAKEIIHSVRRIADLPLIVTCRDPKEGGANVYSAELRRDVLVQAVRETVSFVDMEFANFRKKTLSEPLLAALSLSDKTRLILSIHDFDRPLQNLAGLCREIRDSCPGAIPKLAYTASHINDCFAAFDLLHQEEGDIIVLCMGPSGTICRLLAKKLGSMVGFASLDSGRATAPGQLTVAQLQNPYGFSGSNRDTELFGIIADPVGHSMSPAIHNACFAQNGMNRMYLPLLVSGGIGELSDFLNNVACRSWLKFRGFSVTLPHKRNALDYVRKNGGFIEPLAEKIGAANTLVVNKRGEFCAFNTDYAGAMNAVVRQLGLKTTDLKGKRVAVIGAGGVSRAVVAGFADAGACVTVYNRTVAKARSLAETFGCAYSSLDGLEDLHADLLVNCTSVGMSPNADAIPVTAEKMRAEMAVFDTVYNPLETTLLKNAKQAGAKTVDGLSMFVGQAAAQFRHFTNRDADTDLMRRVAESRLRVQ